MHYAVYPNKFIYMVARERSSFPKSVQPFVVAEQDLLLKPKEYLLELYNMNCQLKVRDFVSQEEAIERTSRFLHDYFHLLETTMAKRQPNPENTETTTEAAPAAPKAERAPRIPKDTVIKLLSTANPKRSGSAAHTRFALYQDGMTVGQFLDAGGTMADINFDMAKKFIELNLVTAASEEPAAEAVAG